MDRKQSSEGLLEGKPMVEPSSDQVLARNQTPRKDENRILVEDWGQFVPRRLWSYFRGQRASADI